MKEHKTREKNIELAEKQLELIDEVLLLRKGHFYDQARVKKGGRINRTMEGKVSTLKQQACKIYFSLNKKLNGNNEYEC